MQDLEFLFTLTAEADRVRARALLLVFEKFTRSYLFQIVLEIM